MVRYANILSIFLLTAATACAPHSDPGAWLAFDSSLDSLIQDSVYYTRPFTLLGEDTLHGNPSEIEYVYYLRIGSDSMLVPANCYSLKLLNNLVASTASETNLGEKYVYKEIYFTRAIDQHYIDSLKKHYIATQSDTTAEAYMLWFDKKGNKLKSLYVGKDDYRMLEVFRYDSLNRTIRFWRREYDNKPYHPDSLRNTPTQRIDYRYKEGYEVPASLRFTNNVLTDTTEARRESSEGSQQWRYTYDAKGNWIKREDGRGHGTTVVYRKVVYK